MADCCSEDDFQRSGHRTRQLTRILWLVLGINAVMFMGEFTAGWLASSIALLGDSLDMLGDTLVYALSLFVLARSTRWKAVSAAFKGAIMLGFGIFVLGDAIAKAVDGTMPQPAVMAGVGVLALVANVVCLLLLTRHRGDDVNMRSAWICSRNDLFANSGVLAAAGLVAATGSLWPDVLVGTLIAGLFVYSAIGVLRDAGATFAAHARQSPETGV